MSEAWTKDSVGDGTVTLAKLGGDITAAGKALLDDASAAAQRTTMGLGTAAVAASTDFASASHTHGYSTITGLPTTLAGYGITDAAPLSHTHAQSEITGLVAALGGKSDTGHAHAASDITSGRLDAARLPVVAEMLANLTVSGNGGKVVAVNSGATALELATVSGGSGLSQAQVLARMAGGGCL